MDKGVEIALLYDFFGGLLTEKQREYLTLKYDEDLSLAEIAESQGISRQGARDAIQRAEKSLREAEERTGLFARFGRLEEELDTLNELTEKLLTITEGEAKETAEALAAALRKWKGQV